MKTRLTYSVMAALALTACTSEGNEPGGGTEPKPKPVVCPIGTDYSFSEEELAATEGLNSFDVNFFQTACNEKRGENVLVSPLSARILLSMMVNGLDADAKQDVVKALGCNDTETLNNIAAKMQLLLPGVDKSSKMALANAFWYSDKYEINPAFSSQLDAFYSADYHARDFADVPTVVRDVNQWCDNHTNGLINEIINDKDITDETMSLLANAMYFKGDWAIPFDKNATDRQTFHGKSAEKAVDMMHHEGTQFYRSYPDFELVKMQFGNGMFNAFLLLPSENSDIDDLASSVDFSKLTANDIPGQEIILSVPRFGFNTDATDLSHTLSDLGMGSMFKPGKIGCLLTDKEGAIKVYQKNAIEFTETGAEGASVSFTLWETSTGEPQTTPVVTFDRPFLLFIAEKTTNACLLAGKILDM